MGETDRTGPLRDVRVLELASLAPAPFGAALLADMGADVVRVDRPGGRSPFGSRLLDRGKRSIVADLKSPEGVELVLSLAAAADMIIEGFRPGVAEKLGVGPDPCLRRRPSLVYGRMTGYGQSGPLAERAGHDINYIAMAGVLSRIGRSEAAPTPPLNLVGDFGGGAMFLVFGLLCALHEARCTGRGQVVDASMVEGSAMLMLPFFANRDGLGARGSTLLDSGAPFYDCYETADRRFVAVGAIEPQFYAALLTGLGLDPANLPDQMDSSHWTEMKRLFASVFRTRTRDEWEKHFEGTDACVTPVLELSEVDSHPHNRDRGSFVDVGGVLQPAAHPRLSATPGGQGAPPPEPGADTDEVVAEWLEQGGSLDSGMNRW